MKRSKWTHEDDEILIGVVNNTEKKSKTQAFKDAAIALNRTEATCAFRWYNVICTKADKETESLDNESVLTEKLDAYSIFNYIERIEKENKQLKEEMERLKQEHKETDADFKELIRILEKSRKLAFSEPEKKFKMDSNGNLERFA